MAGRPGRRSQARPADHDRVYEQAELVKEALASSQRTVVGLSDMVMSPPSWALMSVSCPGHVVADDLGVLLRAWSRSW
jgi:hypothetical protein